METIEFVLRTEFITLDKLLKATGLAASGAEAKQRVAAGGVVVDGREELRKTAKLRPGQVVALPGVRVRLVAAPVAPAGAGQGGTELG